MVWYGLKWCSVGGGSIVAFLLSYRLEGEWRGIKCMQTFPHTAQPTKESLYGTINYLIAARSYEVTRVCLCWVERD